MDTNLENTLTSEVSGSNFLRYKKWFIIGVIATLLSVGYIAYSMGKKAATTSPYPIVRTPPAEHTKPTVVPLSSPTPFVTSKQILDYDMEKTSEYSCTTHADCPKSSSCTPNEPCWGYLCVHSKCVFTNVSN